jgi:hypothetical protein
MSSIFPLYYVAVYPYHKRAVLAQAPDVLRYYVTCYGTKRFGPGGSKFRFRKLLVSDRSRNSHPGTWLL